MSGLADTGFLASLYLVEQTSETARQTIASLRDPLPLIPLTLLELRNSFNLAIARQRITEAERDAFWERFQAHIRANVFVQTTVSTPALHDKARQLSDRHTPRLATRTLDLLHVAAALLIGAREFYSFDERQRQAAAGEGLKVKP